MGLIAADKLIEELEELEEYFENESNRPDDGLANPQRYRDTMSGVAQGLNHAIIVVLDMIAESETNYEKFIADLEEILSRKCIDKSAVEKAEALERKSFIIPDGVGGWKRADEKEVNYQYTTDTNK